MNAKKIVQTFNGRNEWNIGGAGYFKLLSSLTPVDLELYSRTAQVLTADDIEAGFYLKVPFERAVITTPVNQEVAWLFAPDEGGSDRLAGQVSVVEGGKSRTLAQVSFIGTGIAGPTAGNFSHVQLWNASADKRVVLSRITIGSGVNNSFMLFRHNVALTTPLAAPQNKLIGGPNPAAGQFRRQDNATQLGTFLMRFDTLGNSPILIPMVEPIILTPGQGFLVTTAAVNQPVNMNCDFFEEDNL